MLADVIRAQGKRAERGRYRALVGRSHDVAGPRGWTQLVGQTDCGPSDAEIGLLAALGLIASQVGAPMFAGADLALAGDDEDALARWRALRRSEAAPWIGLAAPRVLLRLPYGKDTDPIEVFAFEEFAG